jgi:DNA-binding IclR family transcriptional regulator
VLESFAEEIGETFFLVSARAGSLVVLEKAEGRGFLRAAPRVGSTLPIHATAVGKLYLTYGPEQVSLPRQGALASFTADTLVDRRALEVELDRVRADGFARNQDEWISGLSVLAAPVLLGDRLAGCIALAAATPRLRELDDASLPRRVVEAAGKVTAGLAGSPVARGHRSRS